MRYLALALLFACSGFAADVESLLPELQGKAPAQVRDAAGWSALHAEVLAYFLPKLGAENLGDRKDPALTYQAICWRAARPDAEIERQAASQAIATVVTGDLPLPTRLWLLQILQHVGGPEAVPALCQLASSPDADTRTWALRALAENPDAATGFAQLIPAAPAGQLLERLTSAPALPALVPLFAKYATGDTPVALAAVQALGRTGTPDAWEALATLPASPAVCQAQLHCADGLAANGHAPEALAAYRELLADNQPETVRCGALRGLLAVAPEHAVAVVEPILGRESPRLQGVAADFLRETADETTMLAFAKGLPALSVPAQVLLLDVFAARGATAVRPTVLAALASPSPEVGRAAAGALAQLGDATCVPPLLAAAATPDERGKEATATLQRLGAPGVDDAILAQAQATTGDQRQRCVELLTERRARGAVPALLAFATSDDRKLSAAAWKGLGVLASQADLPALVNVLTSTESDAIRRDAAKAVLAVARREPPGSPRTAVLLAALPKAPLPAQVEILGVLGELGGPAALVAVREQLTAGPELGNAALRALGAWPDAAPADLLLTLARDETDPVRQVLALRGCARALAQPGAPPPAEVVRRLGELMATATRDDDRKVVLAGLGQVPHADALAVLRPYLDNPTLKAEAVPAMLRVAVAVSREDRALAEASLAQIIEHADAGVLREQAEEAKRQIEEYDGFLVNWLLAGPFFKTAEKCAVIDMKLGPESDQAAAVAWQPVALTDDPATDWLIDFEKVFGGSNRVGYAVTWVRCAAATKARFELGSDDGIKVWLDDAVVHRNDAARPVKRGEDVAEVELTPGWHRIMLKVTQGGGHWGACLRLRASDGSPLSDWRTLADFRDLAIMEHDLGVPEFAESAQRGIADITARLKERK